MSYGNFNSWDKLNAHAPNQIAQDQGTCVFGKSFRQQRPEGLLVAQEHSPALVCSTTKSLVAGLRTKSPLLTPKQ